METESAWPESQHSFLQDILSKIKKKIPSDECGFFHPVLLPSGLMLKLCTFSTVYSWEWYYGGGLGASVNSAPFWSVKALQSIGENEV